VLAAVMAVLVVVSIVGLFVDPRTLLGAPVWAKPLKFALSTAIYAVTWSWLIGQLTRFTRVARVAGTLSVILLAIELAIITGDAALGLQSHFNVSNPVAAALWGVMAVSISVLWGATFVVSVLLFRNRLGDSARTLAIRAGAIIALVGMGLAFLMTGPTAGQLSNFQGIAGAHTVGIADGGPGLPILGWSTVAGDLRIPHFVGMHGLQVLVIVAIVLELLARRVAFLRDAAVRTRIVAVATGTYAALLAVLTWQALRGQSIVRPDSATATVTGVIAALTVLALVWAVLRRSNTRGTEALATASR
jgi:hypothetical protein